MNESTLAELKRWLPRPPVLAAWVALIAFLIWSHSETFYGMIVAWWEQPDYGHGFFVPIFALVLLVHRGEMISGRPVKMDWDRYLRPARLKVTLSPEAPWFGALVGGVLGVLLYWLLLGEEDILTTGRVVLAAAYGAVLMELVLLVARLFADRKPDPQAVPDWTWWAMAPFGLWFLLRVTSALSGYAFLDNYSILPYFLGLTLLVGGWSVLRWAWPSIAMLFFMIPLPTPVANGLRDPLQTLSTKLSVPLIQTLGIPAAAVGKVITLPGGHQLEVAQACSGLRMMMLFVAVCAGAVFLMRRPIWQKIVVMISSLPIAVLSNVLRVSVTAMCYQFVGPQWGEWAHDTVGLFMMPVGLVMLLLELALLDRLFIEPEDQGPLALGGSLAGNILAAGRQPIGPRASDQPDQES